jgi:opacity protein-like surface antigen
VLFRSEGGHELEVGLRGSRGREASTSDFDWGPTVSYALVTSRSWKRNRFRYELEATYNDAMTDFQTRTSSLATRVRAAEFRYAKVHLLKLLGFDLRRRLGFVPYASGGIQYVDQRQDSRDFDEDSLAYFSTSTRQRYWSPTFGFGAEVPLNKRVTLALDYGQNSEEGDRKVARLSLELKVAVLDAD